MELQGSIRRFQGKPIKCLKLAVNQYREAIVVKTDALKSLHTNLIDAEEGYDEAIKDTDAVAVKSLFETMRSLHQQAHRDVHDILVAKGEQPNESGSFMSMVHKAVISVRSATTGLDNASLDSFASGEERIVTAYDAAISESGDDISNVSKLTEDRNKLMSMIAKFREQASH
jgi:uncharacterized protein (TIGR02284 family)